LILSIREYLLASPTQKERFCWGIQNFAGYRK